MKPFARSMVILALFAATAPVVAAQSATQVVRFRVLPQQQSVVQHMPAAMAPRGAAGAEATGSYGFASNDSNRKITASLDQAMPNGASLAVAMTAPAGARSAGESTLGTEAVDVVTAIPASQSSGLPVRYIVRAPAGLQAAEQRMVTYTVTAAP